MPTNCYKKTLLYSGIYVYKMLLIFGGIEGDEFFARRLHKKASF